VNCKRINIKRKNILQPVLERLDSRQLMAATPTVDYSTYFGAAGSDTALAITADSAGNTYVAGSSTSSGFAAGGADTTYSGGSYSGDAIVAKFAPDGKPVWSSYLGNGFGLLEEGAAIALDNDGNVYVSGQTASAGWASGGYDSTLGGQYDGFVAKFTNAGALSWSTYIGGSQIDQVYGMQVTGKGVVTVVGETRSSDFASSGFDSSANGGIDGFITRLSTKGQHLSTSYIGGGGDERARGVAMGSDGSLFVVGETTSSSGFVSGGPDTSYGGFSDGFVLQVKPDGTKGWSSYIGAANFDAAKAIEVASDGQLVIAGNTGTAGWISGGYDTSYSGTDDAFVLRMTTSGQTVWSSYVGGTGLEDVKDLAIAKDGSIAVVGATSGGTFVSGGPVTTAPGGVGDGFAMQLTSAGQHKWSTFTGGSDTDYNFGVAFDSQDRMLVAGFTGSTGWTQSGVDTTYAGNTDGFIARYSAIEPFVAKTNGVASIQGTTGNDTIVASIKGAKLVVTRNGITQSVTKSGISKIEVIAGDGDDSVTIGADSPSCYFSGGSGNDTMRGGDANDSLLGGGGKDNLYGGNGDDRLAGAGGHDRLFGETGIDRMYGDAGNDYMDGGGNSDRLWAGDGNDTLFGGSSIDKLYGGDGDDRFSGGQAADNIFGDAGVDTSVTDDTDRLNSVELHV
jgi:Ca2+-binding RTX toxin-like protein